MADLNVTNNSFLDPVKWEPRIIITDKRKEDPHLSLPPLIRQTHWPPPGGQEAAGKKPPPCKPQVNHWGPQVSRQTVVKYVIGYCHQIIILLHSTKTKEKSTTMECSLKAHILTKIYFICPRVQGQASLRLFYFKKKKKSTWVDISLRLSHYHLLCHLVLKGRIEICHSLKHWGVSWRHWFLFISTNKTSMSTRPQGTPGAFTSPRNTMPGAQAELHRAGYVCHQEDHLL